ASSSATATRGRRGCELLRPIVRGERPCWETREHRHPAGPHDGARPPANGTLSPNVSSTQVKISVPGNHLMTGLLGPRDELLRLIEGAFEDVAIHVRGNEITVAGDSVEADRVGRLFEDLVILLQQGHRLEPASVTRTIDMV